MTHNHISNQTMTELTNTARLFIRKGKNGNILRNGASKGGKEAERFAVTIEVVVIDYM